MFTVRALKGVLISVCVFAFASNAHADHYNVVYDGKTYDSQSDTSTFCYTVSGTGQDPELSHVTFGTPVCHPGLQFSNFTPQGTIEGPQTDPTTGVYGIKWDDPQGVNETVQYCYSVNGNRGEGEVNVGIKAGQLEHVIPTTGPTCEIVCVDDVGESCSVGTGVCERIGVVQCNGECSAIEGDPLSDLDICGNELDDNCDGYIDENDCAVPRCEPVSFNSVDIGVGAFITSLPAQGLSSVAAANNNGPDSAIVFNTMAPSGNDPDLGTPNEAFGGPGIGAGGTSTNSASLGKVLIIAENVTDGDLDGLVDDPNDEAAGGTLSFALSEDRLLEKLTIVDIDEDGGVVRGFKGGAEVYSQAISNLGNNSVQTVDLTSLSEFVDAIEVSVTGSGAVSGMELCCDQDFGNSCVAVFQDDIGECPADGTYNCQGECIAERPDADNDGTLDCNDGCPDDPDKIEPGVCGCGVSDVDSDGDGVPDCNDLCLGGDDRLLGMACDGDDNDQCATGVYECADDGEELTLLINGNGTEGLVCTDGSELDDVDGDGVPDCEDQCTGDDSLLGQACDGSDEDTCNGGVFECFEGTVSCNDDLALDDSDGDGVADCDDLCVDDPDKSEPGVCGCGVADTDNDGDGIPDCEDPNDECPEGEECVFDELLPNACAYANGFFEHINIASVINLGDVDLNVRVSYRDLLGVEQGAVQEVIQPGLKRDFIVNELGIAPDTYGTVCVETDATEVGQWAGGNTVYKPDFIDGIDGGFGVGRFDYANYYEFSNPRIGTITAPINTFHLGVDPGSTVANWFSLADATPDDGVGLQGEVFYLDSEGSVVSSDPVNLPDGGRFDFDCHVGLGGPFPTDVIGLVRFVPTEESASYLVSMQRYFYDCPLATCSNIHTAFVVPRRPATDLALNATISTVKNEISVIELSNLNDVDTVVADVQAFGETGASTGSNMVPVPRLGTRHLVVNQSGTSGFLAGGSVGAATVSAMDNEKISALSVFYNVDGGVLQYAYSAPFLAAPDTPQVSEFNSFLGHGNESELYNTGGASVDAVVRVVDLNNIELFNSGTIVLPPAGSVRLPLDLPADTYGTVFIEGSNLVFRNHVIRGNEYTLPFVGR